MVQALEFFLVFLFPLNITHYEARLPSACMARGQKDTDTDKD